MVDEEAKANGLDESLFKRLADAHPSAIVALTHQYRMSANIMALSNELVYSKKVSETILKRFESPYNYI